MQLEDLCPYFHLRVVLRKSVRFLRCEGADGRPHTKEKFVDKHRVVVNVGEANTSCMMRGQDVETGETCECKVSKLGIIESIFLRVCADSFLKNLVIRLIIFTI